MTDNLVILIVDDDLTNRLFLRALIKDSGYHSLEAENGKQAVDIVASQSVDVVLMDVMMPVMDGYESAAIIKKNKNQFIPIIFLTAMKDEASLAKCIEAGGDDFLTKPYNHVILSAKIDSMLRIRSLYNKVAEQNNKLNEHQARATQEMLLAKKVFSGLIQHNMKTDSTGLNFSMSPMSMFNGDVILAERNQTNGLNILISDFTGHGLSAALGAIPVADIFYTMTDKGFSYIEVLSEINNKLVKLLSTSMFMASAFIGMDRNNNIATIVNAGIPEIYIIRDNKIIKTIASSNIPFGISTISPDQISYEIISLEYGDRIIAATDGVMEAENESGDFYGKKRIVDSIKSVTNPEKLFETILHDCKNFCSQADQSDDITLLEICHINEVFYDKKNSEPKSSFVSSNWAMSFNLDIESIKRFDLLPFVMQGINGLQAIPGGYSILLTILTEFYSNALEHGILGLDSEMKNSPDGYMKFYQQKSKLLQKIETGSIRIELNHEIRNITGGRLTIHVTDSGKGFDINTIGNKPMDENTGLSGRGISLVQHLCKEVKFLGKGNAVMAVYEWD